MKNTLIVLLGPTGVGKTDLSIHLARHFSCEIISADSRQFYRGMSTGTASPTSGQLAEIKHHFVGFLGINEHFSASLFERDVLRLLPELFSKCGITLMTGGSGMYIDAVCNGIDDIPDVDPEIRDRVIRKYSEEGIEGLRIALRILDPEHYGKVDLKNPRRIMRALEICETTGQPYSAFLTRQKHTRDFGIVKIGLQRPREELFERINIRVDRMISDGLEEEARELFEFRHFNALNSVGYREFFDFFKGKISREKAVDLIKRNTRRFAKRQMTWWSKDESVRWFRAEEKENIIDYLVNKIREIR